MSNMKPVFMDRVEPCRRSMCIDPSNGADSFKALTARLAPRTTLLRYCRRFGDNVKRHFVLSTKLKQTDVQFVSTLLKERNFTINSFDIVAGVDGALG